MLRITREDTEAPTQAGTSPLIIAFTVVSSDR